MHISKAAERFARALRVEVCPNTDLIGAPSGKITSQRKFPPPAEDIMKLAFASGPASIVGSVGYGAHGEEVASVVSVTTSPTSQSPFGQLKSASLVLRGKYLDALLHRRDDEPTVTAEDNSECTTHFHADYDYDWAIEESKYIPCGSRVRIMWMLHNENYDFFLILRCVNEDTEMFERIGCLNLFQGNEAHVAFQHYFKATSQEEEILIV